MKRKVADLSGQIIGIWHVLQFSHKIPGKVYWLVECVNCKIKKKMQRHNMYPPSGGICQNCRGRPQGYSGMLALKDSYIRNSKNQKREFNITNEEFKNLTSSNCHYCNCPPSLIKRGGKINQKSTWSNYRFNGIDRMDNTIGYIESNCITCCVICNRAKNNMSYDDFLEYINRIKSSAKQT